jgi:CubicO group peptidase (beta-lactamase class C family)
LRGAKTSPRRVGRIPACSSFILIIGTIALLATVAGAPGAEPAGAQTRAVRARQPDTEARAHIAAMAAHHLCAGVFVVGRVHERSPEEVLAMDIRRFPGFNWQDDFDYRVDMQDRSATVWGPGVEPPQRARYHGDQGCTILPRGVDRVFFEPLDVVSSLPDAATQRWPLGDLGARASFSEVDDAALQQALDWAMAQREQNTRALVIIYRGKVIGERYAEGFTKDTPQISWSQGKSITAALVGVLAQQGEITLEEPAPIAEWQGPRDPRRHIRVMDLMRMSSGLDFANYGLAQTDSWSASNEHFRVYFDAVNVFEHATNQPAGIEPNTEFRYRNSDPLTLGRIVREKVEARGESYLAFPQRALFDRIGARNFVLETDAWGNFIMTGYDFGSAWDWARFGLLRLRDGVFEGDRVLAEGWVDFVRTPAPGDPRRGYGGLFWLNRGGAMDRVPEDAFWPSGFMGQQTVVIPSRDMVVVRLGPSPGGSGRYMNETIGRVLEAVRAATR